MRKPLLLATALLCLILPTASFAKDRFLQGRVLLVGEQDELKAVVGQDVVAVESGDTARTKEGGRFRIFLKDIFRGGSKITLSVDKKGWRIQYPLDGEARVPDDLDKELVEIRLLPVGSKKLWSADRIEKFIRDMADKAKTQVTLEGKPQDVDFSRYIKDWAITYGFSAQQAKNEIDKWVAEAEQKNDPYQLGLAAYAKKNFGEAGKLFEESAAGKVRRAHEASAKAQHLTEEAIRDYRLAGDAHMNNYQFDQARIVYESARNLTSRNDQPRLWSDLTVLIGNSEAHIGIRTKGEGIHHHLGNAVEAYQAALTVYTKDQLPQDWAMTQNNLGAVLKEQGIRTGGEAGTNLLAEAVEAYRAALTVRTKDQLPQDWAMTQNNLGTVLSNQGIRTGGEAGTSLLAQAVTAYRAALTVYTKDQLPQDWATTQNNLAKASLALEDWPTAAESYRNVLTLYPDYEDAYQTTHAIYHEKLFAYASAFEVTKRWLERHPNDLAAQANFAEAHLTTARYGEAEGRLGALLKKPNLGPSSTVGLRVVEIVNALALKKADTVPGKLQELRTFVSGQPESFHVDWSFEGTTHFVQTEQAFARYRTWLMELFAVVKSTDRAAFLAALDRVQSSFTP
jgi:tetratricopeptide (TPR) repeat protein